MKDLGHEQIQRYVDGLASAGEIAALHAALAEDAALRALYLDYMNLDVTLGAMAELTAAREDNGITEFPWPQRDLRWVAALAACVALAVWLAFPRHHETPRTQPDIAAALSKAQGAIARLSVEPASPFPSWASPTASLLDQP